MTNFPLNILYCIFLQILPTRTEKDKQMIQRETEEIRISMDEIVRAKASLSISKVEF